jgi:hypothetical protein
VVAEKVPLFLKVNVNLLRVRGVIVVSLLYMVFTQLHVFISSVIFVSAPGVVTGGVIIAIPDGFENHPREGPAKSITRVVIIPNKIKTNTVILKDFVILIL